MDASGRYRLSLPRERVWRALMDPDVLQRCVPGCESLEQSRPNAYVAKIALAVGPVRATFDSDLELTDLEEPRRYRLLGSGRSGAVGFGQGHADVRLEEPEPGVTELSYTASFQVGGRLAQIGSRLVQAATSKIADDFFDAFVAELDQGAVATDVTASEEAPSRRAVVIVIAAAVGALAALAWWLSAA